MAPSSKTQPVSPYPAESIRLEWHRITLTRLSIWVKLIWVSWLDPLPNHSVKCVMMELWLSHGQYKWIRSWALEITLGLHSMRFGPWSSWWVMGIHGDVWSWWTFVDNLNKKYKDFFFCVMSNFHVRVETLFERKRSNSCSSFKAENNLKI